MEKFYIRLYYLKMLHYFFFSLAVMSLTFSVIFYDVIIFGSQILLAISVFYCLSSLYVSTRFLKRYKELERAPSVLKRVVLPYIVLAFYTLGMTLGFALFFPWIIQFVYSLLFINYYIFFVIVIGMVLGRFEIVGKLFEVYSDMILKRAMKIVREYAIIPEARGLRAGRSMVADEFLENVWAHRDYPLPHVRALEKRLILDQIRNIDLSIKVYQSHDDLSMVKKQMEKRTRLLRKFGEIEKKVD